jgi:hypothetical protein
MAEILKNIPTNLTEYPNSFKRQGCFPLEAYSVFYNTFDNAGNVTTTALENAKNYAKTNAIAYVGQTLAVVDAAFKTETVDDKEVEIGTVNEVTFYVIADKTGDDVLQEVGKATNGDDASIVLNNGVLSLKGFTEAAGGTLPQKVPVYQMNGEEFVVDADGNKVIDHWEIQWVSIDAIVEGDGNTKTVVSAGSSNVTVSSNYNADSDTYTYSISVAEQEIPDVPEYAIKKLETPSEGSQATYKLTKDGNEVDVAIEIPAFPVITHPEYTIVKEARTEGATETVYHLAKDGNEVATDIIVPDAYDDTALAGRVAAVENFFKTADGETLNEALDTLIEIQNYINEDGEVAEQVLANKQAIEVLNGSEDTTGSVANAIKVASSNLSTQISAVDTKASNAQKAIDDYATAHTADYTNTQINEAISNAIIAENLGQYAKASDVVTNTDFTTYQDTVSDTYATKAELTAHSTNAEATYAKKTDVYTTQEVDEMIAGINQGNQESAAAVNTKLTNYITSNDKEIAALKEKDVTLTTAVETAQSSANKGIADAAAVAQTVAGHTTSISEINNTLSEHAAEYTALQNIVSGHTTAIAEKASQTTVDGALSSIGTLNTAIETINTVTIPAAINSAVATANAYSSTEIAALNTTVTSSYITKVDSSNNIAGAIAALNISDYAKIADITANYITKTESSNNIAGAIAALNISDYAKSADVYTKSEVYTKTEANATFLTAAQLDTIIDGANNKDTITNVSSLVEYVNNNAGEITGILNAIGVKAKAAEGEPDSEGYKPAVEATGLYAEIASALADANAYTDELAVRVTANETAISSTIPAAIATAKAEAIADAKTETENQVKAALDTVEAKYVTADAENNLSINGQTIVLCGGNAGITAQNGEAAE